MFQWQKLPSPTIGKKNWAALPPTKCAFQPPNQCPRPNRGDLREKTNGAGAGYIYKI